LGDDDAVQQTLNLAIKNDVQGKTFAECSTIHPDKTNELAEFVNLHGGIFVACPDRSKYHS